MSYQDKLNLLKGKRCLCSGCEELFSTDGNFDRHRVGMECKNPADRGMVQDDRGIWKMPPPEVPKFTST